MINFVKETHQYFDGEKELMPVTQLMNKHGLAPNYQFVDADTLEKASKRGSLIHKEIEDYNKTGAVGFTAECENYATYVTSNKINCLGSEVMVYNDIVAGTIDILLNDHDEVIIADIKTTSILHKDAVSWQLSIYNYLMDKKAQKAQAFHFDKDGNLKVVDIPFKPLAEIERLLDCERAGVIYQQNLLVDSNQLAIITEAEQIIAEADSMKKAAEERMSIVKKALIQAMEEKGIKTFETDAIKLTYVAPTSRTSIDSTKLKKDLPDIAARYQKTTEVNASLRIALK
ncbi:MAG: hypothetical protein NC350_03905 [Corallococcus sp.]|nr:hypothetical protein [Corallococcus sp.]